MQQSDPTNRSSSQQAADEAKSLKDEALSKAKKARGAAIDAAKNTAESAKSNVADDISDVGQALRRASEDLRNGSPQERTFGHMASTLADLSDRVRDRDMGDMLEDLSDYARHNPVAFLGGAALAGFAGVRMAKASQRKRVQEEYANLHASSPMERNGAPGRSHGTDMPASEAATQSGG